MQQSATGAHYPETHGASRLKDEIASLDALIEAQTRALKEKLSVTQRLFDLNEDAAKLTTLVRLRRGKKELLGVLTKSAAAAR